MPTIATIQTVVTTISEWQVIQLKPYKARIVLIGFPTNGQAKELPTATWDRLWRDVPRN